MLCCDIWTILEAARQWGIREGVSDIYGEVLWPLRKKHQGKDSTDDSEEHGVNS